MTITKAQILSVLISSALLTLLLTGALYEYGDILRIGVFGYWLTCALNSFAGCVLVLAFIGTIMTEEFDKDDQDSLDRMTKIKDHWTSHLCTLIHVTAVVSMVYYEYMWLASVSAVTYMGAKMMIYIVHAALINLRDKPKKAEESEDVL